MFNLSISRKMKKPDMKKITRYILLVAALILVVLFLIHHKDVAEGFRDGFRDGMNGR